MVRSPPFDSAYIIHAGFSPVPYTHSKFGYAFPCFHNNVINLVLEFNILPTDLKSIHRPAGG